MKEGMQDVFLTRFSKQKGAGYEKARIYSDGGVTCVAV